LFKVQKSLDFSPHFCEFFDWLFCTVLKSSPQAAIV